MRFLMHTGSYIIFAANCLTDRARLLSISDMAPHAVMRGEHFL